MDNREGEKMGKKKGRTIMERTRTMKAVRILWMKGKIDR